MSCLSNEDSPCELWKNHSSLEDSERGFHRVPGRHLRVRRFAPERLRSVCVPPGHRESAKKPFDWSWFLRVLEVLYTEAVEQWQKHVTGARPVSPGVIMRLYR